MRTIIVLLMFMVVIGIAVVIANDAINDKHMEAVLQEKKQTLHAMKLAVGICERWKTDYEEMLITMNSYLDDQEELMEYQAYRLGVQ